MEFNQYEVDALMVVTDRPPLVMRDGQGMWLRDHQGKSYLDFMQGWAVNSLGHAPRCIADALHAQASTLVNPSPGFYNAPAIELAGLLRQHSCFDRVFFTSSGAEANEGAIKLARKYGRVHPNPAGEARFEIITFVNGFHGRTLATMSATGKPGWDTMFAPQIPGFPKATLNDLDSVRALIGPHTVAVMLEPVQGEGGVIPASAEFMQALRAVTREHGLLLIVDEVQTGMGRTGKMFAYEHAGIEPDIMTLGKGIGGGVPLAALLCTNDVACFEPGDQGGTYTGNPLMSAVGVAVTRQILSPGFLHDVNARAEYLSSRLEAFSHRHGLAGERGLGLLRVLRLARPNAAQWVIGARELAPVGLLLNAPKPDLIRFMPALNVSNEEIDLMLDLLERCAQNLAT